MIQDKNNEIIGIGMTVMIISNPVDSFDKFVVFTGIKNAGSYHLDKKILRLTFCLKIKNM
jgi:hypothetical protein